MTDPTAHLDAVADGTAVVVDTATRAAAPTKLDYDEQYVVHDTNGGVHVIDTRAFAALPDQAEGDVTFYTAESFSQYVNQHATDGCAVWADVATKRIGAVLDWHGDSPGWGEHRATLELRSTPEWAHWTSIDGKQVSQMDFAQHLELGEAEIVAPPAADMIALAKTFEMTKAVEFKEAHVLESGARQLVYNETVHAKAGESGAIEIPKDFTIGLAPYEGADLYQVKCRLLYRIDGGKLAIGYQMHRPNVVLEQAVSDTIEQIKAEVREDIAFYRGAVPGRVQHRNVFHSARAAG